jgi:hypothetical protein
MPDAKHNRGDKLNAETESGGTGKPERQASDLQRGCTVTGRRTYKKPAARQATDLQTRGKICGRRICKVARGSRRGVARPFGGWFLGSCSAGRRLLLACSPLFLVRPAPEAWANLAGRSSSRRRRNRLVAGELERRWNKALQAVHRIEGEIAAIVARRPPPLGEPERQQLMQLSADLDRAWSHPAATASTRKRILRTALSEIVVRKEGAQHQFAILRMVQERRHRAVEPPHPLAELVVRQMCMGSIASGKCGARWPETNK